MRGFSPLKGIYPLKNTCLMAFHGIKLWCKSCERRDLHHGFVPWIDIKQAFFFVFFFKLLGSKKAGSVFFFFFFFFLKLLGSKKARSVQEIGDESSDACKVFIGLLDNVTLMRVFIMLIKISYPKICNLCPHGLNIKLVFKHG